MSFLKVSGGKKLHGEYSIQGAKNSVLPLLAATVLCDGVSVLHNCPRLSDVSVSIEILKRLGCKCFRDGNTVTVDSSGFDCGTIPECLMREMRSSIVFMGAVASRCGRAVMSLPGGCELGPRPVDIHIDALKRLGADISCDSGKIVCALPDGAVGTELHLKFPSVGATENIILTAVKGRGVTVINNAAREPEIADLADFLNKAGAEISGAGTDRVEIKGVDTLRAVEHCVMPDRIVAATCMFATAACGGKVKLNGVVYEHLIPMLTLIKDCGCDTVVDGDSIVIRADSRIRNFDTVSTQPFPGFPTDAGPMLVAMSTVSKGTGVFIENIFDSRFQYIDELKRFGADIKTFGRVAVITGVKHLSAADVKACDLRGGAALTVAAMAAGGDTSISGVEFIDRGYERIEDIFGCLNAEIKRYGS